MKNGRLLKLVKVGLVAFALTFIQVGNSNAIAQDQELPPDGGTITCYCNTGGDACASNGATNSKCREVPGDGDCSPGKVNCTIHP